MSERFRQILEEATKQAKEWPEWKKSDDLKRSEHALESRTRIAAEGTDQTQNTKSSAAST